MGNIYVIGSCDNPVKIGRATNLKSRLIQLQIGNPEALEILWHLPVPRDLATHIEWAVHTNLYEHNRRGEWFNVSVEVARDIITQCAERAISIDRREKAEKAKRKRDIIDTIEDEFPLPKNVRLAAKQYREARQLSPRRLRQMDDLIQQGAGLSGLAALRLVLLENVDLGLKFAGNPEMATRAKAAAAKALEHLDYLVASIFRPECQVDLRLPEIYV